MTHVQLAVSVVVVGQWHSSGALFHSVAVLGSILSECQRLASGRCGGTPPTALSGCSACRGQAVHARGGTRQVGTLATTRCRCDTPCRPFGYRGYETGSPGWSRCASPLRHWTRGAWSAHKRGVTQCGRSPDWWWRSMTRHTSPLRAVTLPAHYLSPTGGRLAGPDTLPTACLPQQCPGRSQ